MGEVKVSQDLLVNRAVPTAGRCSPLSSRRKGNNVFPVIMLKAKVVPSGHDVMRLCKRRSCIMLLQQLNIKNWTGFCGIVRAAFGIVETP